MKSNMRGKSAMKFIQRTLINLNHWSKDEN